MTRKLVVTVGWVVAATAVLEAVQHVVMLGSSMLAYHVVSFLLSLALVAVAAWQLETRTRLIEALARAEQLEAANAELAQALRELERSDQLAAAGAIATPLVERLRTLLGQLDAGGTDTTLTAEAVELTEQFGALAAQSRRAMRPVDLGYLTDWVADEVGGATGGPVYCLRPPEPVWVKANPARLELAVRHFLALAAGGRSVDECVVVVLGTTETQASLAIAAERLANVDLAAERRQLGWRIAQAAVTECGGTVDIREDAGGVVYLLHLPLGPTPRGHALAA